MNTQTLLLLRLCHNGPGKPLTENLQISSGRVYTNSGTHTVKQTTGVDTPYILEENIYEMTEENHTVITDEGLTLTLTVQETLVKKYSCVYISKGKLKVEGGFLKKSY